MSTSTLKTSGLAVVTAGIVALVVAPVTEAVHWPFFGGDSGRSGYQPVDEGSVPVTAVYAKTAPTEQFVKSSIITSAGSPATQRLIFGTRDGFVNLQVLGSGAPVGPATPSGAAEAGVKVDEGAPDLDVFGTRSAVPGENGSSVSFVDTSSAAGLGQVFAVHNDDDVSPGAPDIEIAQIDETTGTLVRPDVNVTGTDGFTIQSSAVATGPNATGDRSLFFTANNGAGDSRLFKVTITAAGTVGAVISAAPGTGDIDATPLASPTIASLNIGGTPTAHVLVGTTTGFVRSYRVDTLAVGPVSPNLGGPAQTPSGPVQPSGNPPNGATTEPVKTAPFLYVATAEAATTTVVHKLGPNLQELVASSPLAGAPAPALAVEQEAEVAQDEAKLIVTTGANLYVLNTADMAMGGRFSPTNLIPGVTGYAQTTAAASGDFIYVTNDSGVQQVLRLTDAKAVTAAEFTRDPLNTGLPPNTGVGQPSISRGFVQYAGGQGVFVYRNKDLTDPSVTLTAPAADAVLTGNATFTATAFDARGIASVVFRLNGVPVGTDTVPDSGAPFGAPGAAYSAVVDTKQRADGNYLVDAVATDSSGRTLTSEQRRVNIRNGVAVGGGDDRPPTVGFTAPASGALLRGATTVTMTAADDRGVAAVSLFNGTRLVCTDTTAPYSCSFTPTGADVGRTTLFAIATDTSGQTGSAALAVRVDRFTPTSLGASVTPARDPSAPFRFTTAGRIGLPATVTRTQGCGAGTVSVQIKAGSRTISTRRTTLRGDCSYRSTVSFASRSRLGSTGRLKVTVRFLGNDVLKPRTAASRTVRAG